MGLETPFAEETRRVARLARAEVRVRKAITAESARKNVGVRLGGSHAVLAAGLGSEAAIGTLPSNSASALPAHSSFAAT